ncbi:MAG: NAD-dependent deacylase [Armatimonadetes bacterium]|nr:NAD-dependent deacylase [Armatimonadota bacterium]
MTEAIPSFLVKTLRAARSAAVLTGAGVSAESGLPTFRDAMTGLWAQRRPEDLATAEAFRRDPRLVWEWYAWRRALAAQAVPNPAHFALAEMARRVPRLTLITQNVDGLHQRAGSWDVIELHGSLSRVKCFREDVVVEGWGETGDVPPRCPRCGGPLRPDVVWFGESLPPQALEQATEAAEHCDVFLSVGTLGLVEPAASLLGLAARRGATTALFNLESTGQSSLADFSITGPAGRTLPALLRAAWPEDGSARG